MKSCTGSACLLSMVTCVATTTVAMAQNAGGDGRTIALEEITVTATRVQRDGFTSPTPTTVIGTEELQRTATVNAADFLNSYVPSFAPTTTPGTNQLSTLRPAGNIANLRNLNTFNGPRTLTLVDGRRHVATNPTGSVDMDVIPSALIGRIDVVTGGASAAYGSDAVAGVVNLIFKRKFEGLEFNVQQGMADAGDNEQTRVSAAFGQNLFDGRANVMVGADYVDREGVLDVGERDWARKDAMFISTAGTPQRVLFEDVNRIVSPGGVIVTTSGGAAPAGFVGTTFGPGGSIGEPFTFGTVFGSLATPTVLQAGGSGVATRRELSISVPSERWNIFGRGTLDITDGVSAFAEASYASSSFRDDILTYGGGASGTTTPLWTIQQDYAFLPASILSQMTANGITSFQLARLDTDLPPLTVENEQSSQRYVLGLEGKFAALGSDWRWESYWQRGENEFRNAQINNALTANFLAAGDAIVVGGTPVCRNAAARAAGCEPLNLIGPGPQSAAVLDYFLIDTWSRMNLVEDVFAASINGEPFSTWAGPVSVAAGFEYRKDEYRTSADPYTQAYLDSIAPLFAGGEFPASVPNSGLAVGSTPFNISQPGEPFMTAESDVKEAFVETVVPLAKDLPGARLLEINGAFRRTDYSQSGLVSTWKGGLNWRPIDSVLLRATKSRDIRAPSINELFSVGVTSSPTITDPFVPGPQYLTRVRAGGNRLLVPEEADTFTAGMVLQPSFLEGFTASIDYYDIEIGQAIGNLSAQQIVDRCFSGDSLSCNLITRDPATGLITQIIAGQTNSQELKTNGLDIELVYTLPLGEDHLSFRLLANHTFEFINFAKLDLAGTLGTNQQGVPEWRGSLTAVYENGPFILTPALRYIGSGTWNATLAPEIMAPFPIAARTLVDVNLQYTIIDKGEHRVQAYLNVQNLLDEDPPLNPHTGYYTVPANTIYHDTIGRMFSIGARVTF